MRTTIHKIIDNYPYDLLLLADETVEAIDRYLFASEVYVSNCPNMEEPVGVFCLYPTDETTIEIKNIAVAEAFQGKGIGSRLLREAENIGKEKGCRDIIVGTGDCGIRQIRFYEKNGFVKYGIKKNFFLDKYDKPIYENGVQLRDMVMLRKTIASPQKEVQKAGKEDYVRIMLVWESSVKAIHHFLKQEDFEFYQNILPGFFPELDLYVLRSEEEIVAFMGISGKNLEMLFVSGEVRGKGYGKTLLECAINKFHITEVDVNEQNRQAVGFYEKFGFNVVGRSEKDSMGKDYPILHLRLNKS